MNKKRDSEVSKLRKDLEEANIQQEATLGNTKIINILPNDLMKNNNISGKFLK